MKIGRKFTKAGEDVFASVKWAKRTSRISHTDGSVVFEMKDAEIPADWSQLATDIVVSKYFRKAGIPLVDEAGQPVLDENGKQKRGAEKSFKQVVHRLAGCWAHWGKEYGYFDTEMDAQAFYDELAYMPLHLRLRLMYHIHIYRRGRVHSVLRRHSYPLHTMNERLW